MMFQRTHLKFFHYKIFEPFVNEWNEISEKCFYLKYDFIEKCRKFVFVLELNKGRKRTGHFLTEIENVVPGFVFFLSQ